MSKRLFFAFLILIPSGMFSMWCKRARTTDNKQNANKRATCDIKKIEQPSQSERIGSAKGWQGTYIVPTSKIDITTISTDLVEIKEVGIRAQVYEATLIDGNEVSCFLILDGPNKNEIWATLLLPSLINEEEPNTICISPENYKILKDLYHANNRHPHQITTEIFP